MTIKRVALMIVFIILIGIMLTILPRSKHIQQPEMIDTPIIAPTTNALISSPAIEMEKTTVEGLTAINHVNIRHASLAEIGEARLNAILQAYTDDVDEYFYHSYLIETVGYTEHDQPIIDIIDLKTFTEKATLALERRIYVEMDALNTNINNQYGDLNPITEDSIKNTFDQLSRDIDDNIELLQCREKRCVLSLRLTDAFDLRAFEQRVTELSSTKCYLQRWVTLEQLQQMVVDCPLR